MVKFLVRGTKPLRGAVRVSGSKNAALPILCAALMADGTSVISHVPDIEDVRTMVNLLKFVGADVQFRDHTVTITPHRLKKVFLGEQKVGKMRASILLLGPLLRRLGEVKMAYPGGCVLGKRSLDTHRYALEKLGAQMEEFHEAIHVKAKHLRGATIVMPEMSVTGTENTIMASALTTGTTEIRLAAAEPHVQDLCRFLVRAGAKISGIGTHELHIEGVKKLKGCSYAITADYLEAGTLAIAGIVTNGDIEILGSEPRQLDSFWQKLDEIGARYEISRDAVHIHPRPAKTGLRAIKMLRTAVYPSFPTDLQAPFSVALTQANGVSKIYETLFEGRLNYLFELEKMGAHVEILNPHQALIIGPTKLSCATVSSCDIRAGATMVLAALAAEGETEITDIRYIDRGYERLDEKLRTLGADIHRL